MLALASIFCFFFFSTATDAIHIEPAAIYHHKPMINHQSCRLAVDVYWNVIVLVFQVNFLSSSMALDEIVLA